VGEEREVEENGGEEREGKETDGCPLTVFAVKLLWYIPELVYCTDYQWKRQRCPELNV
jgi:hypothetical protein